MPSLPPPSMSTSTLIDDKYAMQQEAALAHIKQSQSSASLPRKKSKSKPSRRKAVTTIGFPTTLPSIEDFILFPDNAVIKPRVSSKDARRNEDMTATPTKSDVAVAANSEPPRRKRVPRHGGFRIVSMADADSTGEEERKKTEKDVPPPAPSPPILDSPCLSDVDDDEFWGHWRREGRKASRNTAA